MNLACKMNSLSVRNSVCRSVGRYLTSSLARPKEVIDPVQEAALKENCFLVDMNDNVIGTASKRECHAIRKDGSIPLHRAFSVFLFNKKQDLLLQKRADTKLMYPGHYSSSCTGHPLADIPGEDEENDAKGVKRGVQRRLLYELGINPNTIPIEEIFYLTRIYHCDIGNGKWGEHEIIYIMVIQKDFKLKANSNELTEVSYIPKGKLNHYITTVQAPLEPIFEIVYKNMLHLWWNNLGDLDSVKNHDDIIRFDKCK